MLVLLVLPKCLGLQMSPKIDAVKGCCVCQRLVEDIPPCDLPDGCYPGGYDLYIFWFGVTMFMAIGSRVGAVRSEHNPVEW